MSTIAAKWWTNSSTIIVARVVPRKTVPQRAPRMLPGHITTSAQPPLISRPRTIDNRIQIFNSWIKSRLASFLLAYLNHTWLQVTHRRQSKARLANPLALKQEWQIRQDWTLMISRIYGSSMHCSNSNNNNTISSSSSNSNRWERVNIQAMTNITSWWLN